MINNWDGVAIKLQEDVALNGTWHQIYDIDPIIIENLGNIKDKYILDLACGTGHFSRLLDKNGANVTAVDNSSLMIKKAKELSINIDSKIKYILEDAEFLTSIKSNSYDIVICNMGIHNFKNAKQAISQVSRILKDNGRFLFVMLHPFVSRQPWGEIYNKGHKYYGKYIYRYMTNVEEIDTLSWANNIQITQYHRPLEYYVSALKKSNLLIMDLKEITTKKPLKYSNKESNKILHRRSLYHTKEEKILKENTKKEIPLFLFMDTIKYRIS